MKTQLFAQLLVQNYRCSVHEINGCYEEAASIKASQTILVSKTAFSQLNNLSPREKEVLALIVKEFTSEEIGNKLFISKKTVDNHRQNLFVKCNCKSTIGLVKYALKNGFE